MDEFSVMLTAPFDAVAVMPLSVFSLVFNSASVDTSPSAGAEGDRPGWRRR